MRGRTAVAGALGLTLTLVAGAQAQSARTAAGTAPGVALGEIRASAVVAPEVATLGAALTYRVTIRAPQPFKVRFIAPEAGGAFSWGRLAAYEDRGRNPNRVGAGAWVDGPAVAEIPLQVFAHGQIAIPGLVVDVDDGRGPRRMRVPVAKVLIAPVLAANDTAADLRPPRGPLAAPWWERVPWPIVIAVLLALGFAVLLWWRWRNRRRRVVAAPAAPPPRPVDPLVTALAELAALKRLGLPARGEYADHAFRLTRIVRRFIESATGFTRPGDTTPELVERLGGSPLPEEELRRLEGLLRTWDRVKFARAATSPEAAARAEQSVEEFLRHGRPPAGRAA